MKRRFKRGDLIRRRDVDWFGIVLGVSPPLLVDGEEYINVAWVGYIAPGEIHEEGYCAAELKEWYVPRGSR